MIREVVTIDEELCDGCGECVPACAEGAIQVIAGKARLVSDVLCDGLGACLGHCPQGAIDIDRREAEAFDEAEVQRHLADLGAPGGEPRRDHAKPVAMPVVETATGQAPGGCPSSRFARFEQTPRPSHAGPRNSGDTAGIQQHSELTHWPIQLRLLPPTAPVLKGARLLIAADCVPFAYRGFHGNLLRDHAVVIACPKLDDPTGYVEKLAEMIRCNDLAEISVARMEVPCCMGILQFVVQARQLAGSDVTINDTVISVRGEMLAQRPVPADSKGFGNLPSAGCPSTRS